MKKLFVNIKGLLLHPNEESKSPLKGQDLGKSNIHENAYLYIEQDKIVSFGQMAETLPECSDTIDCTGRFIIPSFCDSHTHIIFAATRESEFVDRINGLSYEQISANGGGILNSAKKMVLASEESLLEDGQKRLDLLKFLGTGAVEIKSGYALTLEGELKMLRVIKRLKTNNPDIEIKSTFLGAHAIPLEFKSQREKYISLINEEMIPAVAEGKLADYCDVFCETGFFTPEETLSILTTGIKYGLKPKVHANELDFSGGVQVGVKLGALSVDHLECLGDAEFEALKNSNTIATLLPGTAFFLGIHYAPARRIINENIALALASDYNPGTTPSGNMALVIALACIGMKMMPIEAINAATFNGSFAMEVQDKLGSITLGKKASFIITKPLSNLNIIPYEYGHDFIGSVYLSGNKIR